MTSILYASNIGRAIVDTSSSLTSNEFDVIKGTSEKDEYWYCADPACKTPNTFDTNICENCKLSSKFTYEKSGRWGQTKVKDDDDTGINYKKWTVIHTYMNTINIRDSRMQTDFLKFSDSLKGFLKNEEERAPLSVPDVDSPDDEATYVYISEGIPYRIEFRSLHYSDIDPECPEAGDKVQWLVIFVDVGKWDVIDPKDLVELQNSSFCQQAPLMKRCILEHIRFKTVNTTKQAKINSWMQEQLLNKAFVMSFMERHSTSRFKSNTTVSYVDIILEDDLHFKDSIVEEFEDFLLYNENLNMS